MESSSSFADRLAALEARVNELEAAGESAPEAAVPAETQVEPGRTEPTPTEAAPAQVPVGSAADALPDDADTFWALHGLVDRFGAEGGVTYTGYTTPPGAEGPVAWQMGLTSEGLNEIDFAEAAGCLAALGHPVRLQLLQAIYEGTTTVAELSKDERFGTTGQIYHHVHALAGAGWLASARRGHWRVPSSRVIPLLTLVLIGTH
jgi:hypothetical protein